MPTGPRWGHLATALASPAMSALLSNRDPHRAFPDVSNVQILLQKSAILVVGLPLRPLEADSDYSFSHWTLVGV
jgi:hypothetical protein